MARNTKLLRAALLGSDPKQQLRASQVLLVLASQCLFAAVQHAEVMFGLIALQDSWPLSVFSVGTSLLFYAVIRSGLNLRLPRDRALAVPQTLQALICLNWSYAITGQARGAILLIMVSVILFSMFSLSRRQQVQLTTLAIASLGGVMLWKAGTDPIRYEPRVEAVHFLFAAIVLGLTAGLAARIGAMRQRLQDQKRDLSAALDRIQSLATRDELTGLLNRRAAIDRLQLELREPDLRQPQLSVGLVDLDHFKRVNDTLGHAAGDAVLRRFAEAARQEVRGTDVLARWGGEEFLLVMPSASAEQAVQALGRIRVRLQAAPMDDIQPGLRITFSAGVAQCRTQADIEAAIERADAAMYRAKKAGRDRTLLADAPPAAEDPVKCATLADSRREAHTPE